MTTTTPGTHPTRRRMPAPVVLCAAFLGGALWGVNARIWMRFVSTDPEFTWSGTISIVVVFAVAALGQSAAWLGRQADLRRPALTVLRVVGTVCLVPIGSGAGIVMLPTILLAPLALTQRRWPSAVRIVVALFASLGPTYVITQIVGDVGILRSIAAVPWFTIIYAATVWAATCSLGPQQDGWHPPSWVRVPGFVLLIGLPLVLVTFSLLNP